MHSYAPAQTGHLLSQVTFSAPSMTALYRSIIEVCIQALACNSCSVTCRTCLIYKHSHLMKDISPGRPHMEIKSGTVLDPTALPPLLNSSSFVGSFGDPT